MRKIAVQRIVVEKAEYRGVRTRVADGVDTARLGSGADVANFAWRRRLTQEKGLAKFVPRIIKRREAFRRKVLGNAA